MISRRRTALALGLGWCLWPSVSLADPVALRLPGSGSQWAVEAGWRDVTVALWFRGDLGVGVDVGLRGEAVGLSFGGRHALLDGPLGWGVDVYLAGGFRALLVDPGLALTVTPAISAGARGPVLATLGLAVPAAIALGKNRLRVPLLVELRLGGQPGPFSFGVRGALGPVLVPRQPTAVAMQWSAWFAVRIPAAGAQADARTRRGPHLLRGAMKTIRNLTSKPIKVPLPGGKALRLGPKAEGVVRDEAAEHRAVARMITAGTIELLGGSTSSHGPAPGEIKL